MSIRTWALASTWLVVISFGCYRRTMYCADDFPCDPGNTCNLTLRLCEPLGDGSTGNGGDGSTADGSAPAAPACAQFASAPTALPLDTSSLTSQSNFGKAIALSSTNWVAIGAPGQGTTATGAVYLYKFSAPSAFGNAQMLTSFPDSSQAGAALAFSTDGNTLFIGAPTDGSGKVYVYQNNGSTWTVAKIILPNLAGTASFGQAVAVNDSLVVVGAPAASSNDGVMFTFLAKSPWTQQGAGLPGTAGKAGFFGAAVGVINGQLLVGAPNTAMGDVSAYTGTDGSWTPSLLDLGSVQRSVGAKFGSVIAVTDTTMLIGSPVNNGVGSVASFTQLGGFWQYQSSLTFPSAMSGDSVGSAVALYGSSAIVGASNAANTDGAAAVFHQAGPWGPGMLLSATVTGASPTYFGSAVALNAKLAVIGARGTVVAGSAKGLAFAYPCMQ